MKLDTVKQLLNSLGVPSEPHNISGVFFNIKCPFAPWYHKEGVDNNPSFGITFGEGERSFYKCLSCQQKGQLTLLPAKMSKLTGKNHYDLVEWAERAEFDDTDSAPPPEWNEETAYNQTYGGKTRKHNFAKLSTFGSAIGHPYLVRRGYTCFDTFSLDLRYDTLQKRVLFPVYNQHLGFEGFTGRSVMSDRHITKGSGNNPKSRDYGGLRKDHLFLFNKKAFARKRKPDRVILVEGPFDYARVFVSGFRGAHAVMGTASTQPKIDWLLSMNCPVYLFFDDDAAGDAAMFGVKNQQTGLREDAMKGWANALYKHLPVWICSYPRDAQLMGRGDPDSLYPYEIQEAVENAWLYGGLFSLPEYDNQGEFPF